MSALLRRTQELEQKLAVARGRLAASDEWRTVLDHAHAEGVKAGRGETATAPTERYAKWVFEAGVTEGRRQLMQQAQNVAPFVAQIITAEWGGDGAPDNVVPIRPKGDA